MHNLHRVAPLAKQLALLRARKGLLHFVRYVHKGYQTGWFNELLCAELDAFIEDMLAGRRPRLILSMPPRSGKTELASITLPAYFLGRFPHLNIIACSYSADLANRVSRSTQRLVASESYAEVFPNTRVPKANGAAKVGADFWEVVDTTGAILGGSYRSAGVGGGITGQGMHLGIIDDPVKDYQDAISPVKQESAWDWFNTTFATRADPKMNGMIVIATRWHPQDLIGKLLAEQEKGGIQWRYLKFPMEAEEDEYHELGGRRYRLRKTGDILFPERMPLPAVDAAKRLGAITWAGLYQQRPTLKGGGLVKSAWFDTYSVLPKLRYRAIYADTAQKKEDRHDYSVFLCAGLGFDDRVYLIDLIRGKWESYELEQRAIAFWQKHRAVRSPPLRHMAIEDKASGTGLIQNIRRQAKLPVKAVARTKDKFTRLMDTAGYMESGYVKIPESALWVSDFLVEMDSITADFVTHDDQLDVLMSALEEMKVTRSTVSIARKALHRV